MSFLKTKRISMLFLPVLAAILLTRDDTAAQTVTESGTVTAATAVSGSGTPGQLPVWTGSTTIGDSLITQTALNRVGVGTTFPAAKFHAYVPNAIDSPNRAILGSIDLPTAGIGVIGDSSASSGLSIGVYGRSGSPAGAGGFFENWRGGDLIQGGTWGTGSVVFRVASNGDAFVRGQQLVPPPSSLLDVKTCCGAVGDGSANDLPAIQRAIALLGAQGGTILFPTGRYLVSGVLDIATHGITLQGTGKRGSVILSNSATGPVIRVGPTSPQSASAVTIRDLTIDRVPEPADSSAIGIHVQYANNALVEHVAVNSSWTSIAVGIIGGICAVDCNWATHIVDAQLFPSRTASPQGAAIAIYSSADGRIDRATIVNSSNGVGVYMLDNSNGWIVSNTLILFGNYGFYLGGTGFVRHITHSLVESAKQQQVYLTESTYYIKISDSWLGNGIACPLGTEFMRGVLIESTVREVQIHNNRIGQQCNSGIQTFGSVVSISGNNFDGNSGTQRGDSVDLTGGGSVQVTGNRISSTSDRCSVGLNGVQSVIVTSNLARSVCGTALRSVVTNNLTP